MKKILLITTLALFGLSNANAQWVQSLVNNDNVTWITSDATNMFASTDPSGGKMYKSTDQGATWNTSNSGFSFHKRECVAISGTTILAGTYGGGIYKSTDNGATWATSNTGLTNLNVIRITVSGSNIYAGTFAGVFLSIDNGSTWTPKNSGIENVIINAILVNGSDIFIGTNNDTVMRSSDGGASWVSKSNGFTYKSVSSFVVSGSKIFAGSQGLDAVFVTTDNGENWTVSNTGIPASTPIMGMEIIGTNIFAISYYAKVYHSTDDGSNWADVSTGLPTTNGGKLHIRGSNIFAATSGKGIWKRALSELGITTNIVQIKNKNDISIFPNPSTGKFVIQISDKYQVTSFEVFNMLGKKVLQQENSNEINLSNSPKGIYFVKIYDGENSTTKKIIVE